MMTYVWGISQLLNRGCPEDMEDINLLMADMQEPFIFQKSTENRATPPTSLGLLYLKLIQYEYLGRMYDLLKIYEMTANIDYPVPTEGYMKKMWEFQEKRMSLDDIEMFFLLKIFEKKLNTST